MCYNIIMDSLEYLNQISQSNRPIKPANKVKAKLLNGSIIKIALGGIVLFFLLMIIGSMLGNLNAKPENLTKQLYTRTINLNSTISTYGKTLKSSRLRSINSSLSAVLVNSSNQLSSYIKGEETSSSVLLPDEETVAAEAQHIAQLDSSLNNAKLNGILDRIYASQIDLEVSLLLSMISELEERAKGDTKLITILSDYYSNLKVIHDSLEAYSETPKS